MNIQQRDHIFLILNHLWTSHMWLLQGFVKIENLRYDYGIDLFLPGSNKSYLTVKNVLNRSFLENRVQSKLP